MTEKKILQVAKNAHNVCRAFELANGAKKILTWKQLNESDKKRVCDAVELLTNNRKTYAASVHNAWIDNMIDMGWTYGRVYDEVAKTSPDMVDYRSLPPLQRAKDRLFHQVVKIGYIEPIR